METSSEKQPESEFIPTFLRKNYQFDYSNVGNNGLILQNFYIPEEILLHIFSFIYPKLLLDYSLVCHNWNKLIKSNTLWYTIYERQYKRKPKKLPWYLYYCLLATNYFDTNLLLNEDQVDEYPKYINLGFLRVPDYFSVNKLMVLSIKAKQFQEWCQDERDYIKNQWLIKFKDKKILRHILDVYKPHICLTKWGKIYQLRQGFLVKENTTCGVTNYYGTHLFRDTGFRHWIDIVITQYSEGIEGILLEIKCKYETMKNVRRGDAKLLFDSIEPIDDNEISSKKYLDIQFLCKGRPAEDRSNY